MKTMSNAVSTSLRRWMTIPLVGVLVLANQVSAVTSIRWEKQAIPLELIVGVEQLVHFDGPASVGLPQSIADEDTFQHLFTSNTAYWKALAPFDRQRIKVHLQNTGEFLLFDITAVSLKKPPASTEPLKILMSRPQGVSATASVANTRQYVSEDKSITMFDLIRFAVQEGHSPARVVEPVGAVRPIDHKVSSELSRLYNHQDAVNVDMFAIASWSAGGLYVTSIEVRNRSADRLEFEPSRMQHTARSPVNGLSNHFVASAMIRPMLAPRGKKHDRTLLYVVTDKPFDTVIDL